MPYHLNFPGYVPILSSIVRRLALLAVYGTNLCPHQSGLQCYLLSWSQYPLETLTVAEQFNLEYLAVEISKHLLTNPPYSIIDEVA